MNELLSVPEIAPIIVELNQATKTLDLSLLTSDHIYTHFDRWDTARVGQTASVIINQPIDPKKKPTPIANKPVRSIDGTSQDGILDNIPIPIYTDGVLNFKIGSNTLYYIITTEDGTGNPNQSFSAILNFRVIYDEESGSLKIDITEGAAAYTDDHKYLMPANIAIVRGVPGTIWKAHGDGNTRFQEAGGANSVLFQLDDKGICPINLIKIDRIDVGPRSNAALAADADGITISRKENTIPLLTSPVVFGDYQTPSTGTSKFKSYCVNSKGIADGSTISIISIIMQDTSDDNTIKIRIDDELTFVKDTLRNEFNFMSSEIDVNVKEKTAEFAITCKNPGSYKIQISTPFDDDSFFEINAKFDALS